MKTTKALIFFVLTYFNLYSQNVSSEFIYPKPFSGIADIAFYNDTQGYLFDRSGILYHTNNAGATWEKRVQNVKRGSHYIFFKDSLNGVSASFQNFRRTNDGGQTWEIKSNLGINIYGIYFFNLDTCFISSTGGNVIRTQDGGVTWDTMNTVFSKSYDYVRNVTFTSRDTGYFLCNNELHKSTDGGENWSLIKKFNTYSTYFHFLNNNYGYVKKDDGQVYRTKDGGITWDIIQYGQGYGHRVLVLNESTVLLSNEENKIYKSVDGGNSWKAVALENGNGYYDFKKVNDSVTIIYNQYGYSHRTNNNGESWKKYSDDIHNEFYNIDFFENIGIVIGGDKILRTDDYGLNWKVINLSPNGSIFRVHFKNKDTVFITDRFNGILRSVDGGLTWLKVNTDGGREICYVDNLIFATGDNQNVLKSNNGGNTWQSFSTGESSFAFTYGMDFMNKDTGYMVISYDLGNYLLQSFDGGVTWKRNSNINDVYINDVEFWDSKHGYVGGEYLHFSNDGGINWQKTKLKTMNSIQNDGIQLTGQTSGFVFSYPYLYYFLNAGQKIDTLALLNQMDFPNGFHMINDSVGFFCGRWGEIVKITLHDDLPLQINTVYAAEEIGDLKISSNPNNGHFFITCKDFLIKGAVIKIVNIKGQELYSQNRLETEKIDINLCDVESGVYAVILSVPGKGYRSDLFVIKKQ